MQENKKENDDNWEKITQELIKIQDRLKIVEENKSTNKEQSEFSALSRINKRLQDFENNQKIFKDTLAYLRLNLQEKNNSRSSNRASQGNNNFNQGLGNRVRITKDLRTFKIPRT